MNNLNTATNNIINSQILADYRWTITPNYSSTITPTEDVEVLAGGVPKIVSSMHPAWSYLAAGRPIELKRATFDVNSFPTKLAQVFFLDSSNSAITTIGTVNYKQDSIDQFKDMVRIWRFALKPHHFTGLISRLEYIFEDEPDLSPKQKQLNPESFSALLAYVATKPEFKTPSISYNRDGSFSASWQTDKKIRLTLDFISLTRIRWVFVDNHQGLEQVISGAGIVTNNMLQGILESYGGLDWMRV